MLPSVLQLQYLQIASFADNRLTSTEGIAHPMLETLNLSSECVRVHQDSFVRPALETPSGVGFNM